MHRKLKIAYGIGFALAALVLLVVVVWTLSVDRAIASSIEYYGSQALGTRVRVGSVSLSTAEGKGVIRQLRIAQPEGFGEGDAVVVGEITLGLDPASLVSGDPIVITLVRVVQPEVHYVIRKDRSTNLAALQANLDRYAATGAAEPPPRDDAGTRLRIVRLEIEGGRAEADLTDLGIGRAEVPLTSLQMDDLGGTSGQPPGQIGARIGSRFMTRTLTTIAESTIGRRLRQLFDQGGQEVRGMLDALFPR